MDSIDCYSGRCLTGRFVVRHTFIDVTDVPAGRPMRTRASSESDLFSRCPFEELPTLSALPQRQTAKQCQRQTAKQCQTVDSISTVVDGITELGGFSDAETMSLDEEPVQEGEASDAQSEVGTECGSTSTPLSQWSYSTQSKACSSGSNSGLHIDPRTEQVRSLEATSGQSALQEDVELLLSENLRLQTENRLLRESLVVSASSGASVSRPSSDQLPPEQLNAKADDCTTVMLRNLPNNYTRTMVLSMLDEEGFAGLYDFLYLPMDFKTGACLGYAFINLVDAAVAAKLWRAFDGYHSWVLPSRKVCHISWSGPHQGQKAHIERYRNSPIMHESVPDECKPMVFKDGVRTAFPGPTKSTKAPRLRTQRPRPVDVKRQTSRCHFSVH